MTLRDHSRQYIITIVDDSKVDKLKAAIVKAASSSSEGGDGKIFVSEVEDAVDISSGRTGINAI